MAIEAELRTEVFEYIELFFLRRRRRSPLGMLSPADCEDRTLASAGDQSRRSRLAAMNKIKFTAPTPSAIALINSCPPKRGNSTSADR